MCLSSAAARYEAMRTRKGFPVLFSLHLSRIVMGLWQPCGLCVYVVAE
jgi:hypothetical protein